MNPFIEFTKWLLRWAALIFAGLLALALVIAAVVWGWYWWDHERHVAKVTIGIVNDEDDATIIRICSGEHPIFVRVSNNSSRTIESTSINVSAYLPDHSTDILNYPSTATTDRIIKPGSARYTCWRFNVKDKYKNDPALKKAIYKARLSYVTFAQD